MGKCETDNQSPNQALLSPFVSQYSLFWKGNRLVDGGVLGLNYENCLLALIRKFETEIGIEPKNCGSRSYVSVVMRDGWCRNVPVVKSTSDVKGKKPLRAVNGTGNIRNPQNSIKFEEHTEIIFVPYVIQVVHVGFGG